MVFAAHLFQVWTWSDSLSSLLPIGHFGVVIFFVLSGFLITKLLLEEPLNKPLILSCKEFYIRRSLRIFPIYYLFLAFIYYFNVEDINAAGIMPWLYLTNIHIFNQNSWIGSHSHLWTLAIEEQFYLIWPFVILFLRSRIKILLISLIFIIFTAILSRIILYLGDFSSLQIKIFSLTVFDFFAFGSLISIGCIYFKEKLRHLISPLLFFGITLYYGSYYLMSDIAFSIISQFSLSLISASFIIFAIYSKNNSKNNFLHNKVTIDLGKISYGIYLYHNIIIAHWLTIAEFIGLNPSNAIYNKIVFLIMFTIILAKISYRFIEKPFLQLKDNFRS